VIFIEPLEVLLSSWFTKFHSLVEEDM